MVCSLMTCSSFVSFCCGEVLSESYLKGKWFESIHTFFLILLFPQKHRGIFFQVNLRTLRE